MKATPTVILQNKRVEGMLACNFPEYDFVSAALSPPGSSSSGTWVLSSLTVRRLHLFGGKKKPEDGEWVAYSTVTNSAPLLSSYILQEDTRGCNLFPLGPVGPDKGLIQSPRKQRGRFLTISSGLG